MKREEILKIAAEECMAELDAIGIAYVKPLSFAVNTRAKKRFGQCRRRNNIFTINIMSELCDEKYEAGLKNTIIHELLHTVDGCMNHGEAWKREADRVKQELGYEIKRTSSRAEKGLPSENVCEHMMFIEYKNDDYYKI